MHILILKHTKILTCFIMQTDIYIVEHIFMDIVVDLVIFSCLANLFVVIIVKLLA